MTQPAFPPQIQQLINQLQAQNRVIHGPGGLREALQGHEVALAELKGMKDALSSINISGFGATGNRGGSNKNGPLAKMWGGNAYVSIDDIPGRAVPYDLSVNINIASGVTDTQQESAYISNDGPFIAVRRWMAFRSSYTFEVQDAEGNAASYVGRTSGRFRPISSHQDIMDAVHAFEQVSQYQPSYVGAVIDSDDVMVPVTNPLGLHPTTPIQAGSTDLTNLLPNFPGNGRPIVVSPLSMSAGRSMCFDATVAIEVAGANYQRQNNPVPSAVWMRGMGSPLDLAACDVFEPGDSVVFKVTPTHENNPAFGDIQSLMYVGTNYTYDAANGGGANNPMPVGPFPFVAGQFDGHEGINGQSTAGDSDTSADPNTRSPDGILTIGYQGYKLLQAPRGV